MAEHLVKPTSTIFTRRSVYIYLITAASLILIGAVALSKPDTPVAGEVIQRLVGLIETCITFYLPLSAVDRAGVLHGLAARIRPVDASSRPSPTPNT